jgi:hypothetical protein
VINQATHYFFQDTYPIASPYTATTTVARVDSSRLAGARYEVGLELWNRANQRFDVELDASPRMHALIHQTGDAHFSATDPSLPPLSDAFSDSIPETASLVDAQARWSVMHGRSTWSLGLRYLNHASVYDDGGYLADRNRLVLPFLGWATRL